MGNVTADTELTYEYGVRTQKKRQQSTATATPSGDQDKDTPKCKGMHGYESVLIINEPFSFMYIIFCFSFN